MNNELKHRIFDIPQNVLDKINHTIVGLNGEHFDGVNRAKKLLLDKKVKNNDLRVFYAQKFIFFYKNYQAKVDLVSKISSILGMQVVAAFFLTGLTNSNFDLQIYSTMYAVLVCLLARLSMFEINAAESSILPSPAAPSC